MKHFLKLSQVASIFVDSKFLPVLLPAAQEVGLDASKIYIGNGSAPGRRTIHELISHVLTKSIPFVGIKPAKKDTLAYLVFSSGTSGLPKGLSTLGCH